LADELQKSKFSTTQGNFGKIIGIEGNELCYVNSPGITNEYYNSLTILRINDPDRAEV
jgi:hypothetical protein